MKIAEWVREERERRSWTQEELSTAATLSSDMVSKTERGARIPTSATIAALWHAFGHTGTGGLTRVLLDAELERIERAAQQDRESLAGSASATPAGRAHAAIRAQLDGLPSDAAEAPTRSLRLDQFPAAFTPMAIVYADRRETPPKRPGDNLALSAAVPDFQFIAELGLDPALARSGAIRVFSDKIFAEYTDQELVDILGDRHLVVIGSVAANAASRRLNRFALFPFPEQEPLRLWQEHHPELVGFLREHAPREADLRPFLHAFRRVAYGQSATVKKLMEMIEARPDWEDLVPAAVQSAYLLDQQHVDALHLLGQQILAGMRKEEWLTALRGREVWDLLTPLALFHPDANADYDYATLGLARNPFAADGRRVAILAAGIHGPGTAAAVRMLARPEQLADHPAGGLLRVQVDPRVGWHDRIWLAPFKFESAKYDYAGAGNALRQAAESEPERRPRALRELQQDEIADHLLFLEQLATWHGDDPDAGPLRERLERDAIRLPFMPMAPRDLAGLRTLRYVATTGGDDPQVSFTLHHPADRARTMRVIQKGSPFAKIPPLPTAFGPAPCLVLGTEAQIRVADGARGGERRGQITLSHDGVSYLIILVGLSPETAARVLDSSVPAR